MPHETLVELLVDHVLECIGELPLDRLDDMDLRGRATFAIVDWRPALYTMLQLPAEFPESVRELWDEHRASTEDAGFSIAPEQFARTFVERNLAEH